LEAVEIGKTPAGDDEICSGPRKSATQVLAEAATGTGDDGYFAGEVEGINGHACLSWFEYDFHQSGFVVMEALEPIGAILQRYLRGDERIDNDLSGLHEANALRIFSSGGA
jgi:hypothetical protein